MFLFFYRYNASVNFTEGRCPDSNAMVFDKILSRLMLPFVTIPNVNIGDCDYTIALWLRPLEPYEFTYIFGSSRSGKRLALIIDGIHALFCHEVSPSILIDTTCVNGSSDLVMNNWFHIAATCEQDNRIKIFFNGEKANLSIEYSLGNFQIPLPKNTFVIDYSFGPVIMDLHILGYALPRDEIDDLSRG